MTEDKFSIAVAKRKTECGNCTDPIIKGCVKVVGKSDFGGQSSYHVPCWHNCGVGVRPIKALVQFPQDYGGYKKLPRRIQSILIRSSADTDKLVMMEEEKKSDSTTNKGKKTKSKAVTKKRQVDDDNDRKCAPSKKIKSRK